MYGKSSIKEMRMNIFCLGMRGVETFVSNFLVQSFKSFFYGIENNFRASIDDDVQYFMPNIYQNFKPSKSQFDSQLKSNDEIL